MINFTHHREKMVNEQIIKRGIKDENVIRAMLKVERHRFVDKGLSNRAYQDTPLPIGCSQTISQPYMVALMTESLKINKDSIVLEVGTGSGYQAAILAELVKTVYTIEREHQLARRARKLLDELMYSNIVLKVDDGSLGWSSYAPFDGIIVTAGAPLVPRNLLEQLSDEGRIVIPVGDMRSQNLYVYEKDGDKFSSSEVCGCAFVPLVGAEGWSSDDT